MQEVEPAGRVWLPVMPITSGELTLRPAGEDGLQLVADTAGT